MGNVSAMTNLIPTNTVSSSAQLATKISGAFDAGFEYEGTISGSVTSTGSLANIQATTVVGEVSGLTGLIPSGVVSSSAQIASRVSGSFNKGFEFTGTIKKGFGTWSEVNDMIASRDHGSGANASVGTKSTLIVVNTNGDTESWNGTNWSEVNNRIDAGAPTYPQGLKAGGASGTTNSGIFYGGKTAPNAQATNITEEWNGTNWSESTSMIYGRTTMGTAGYLSSENALAFGGDTSIAVSPAPSEIVTYTEEWNGSSWTELSDMNTNKYVNIGVVSSEAAFGVHVHAGCTGQTEEWNGSSWSELGLNACLGSPTNMASMGGVGGGTVNDGHIWGGTYLVNSLIWDGTSWSADAVLNTARTNGTAGRGTTSGNVIAAGGSSPIVSTEVFTTSFTTGSFGRVEVTSI